MKLDEMLFEGKEGCSMKLSSDHGSHALIVSLLVSYDK
jgi:hypothetical protein